MTLQASQRLCIRSPPLKEQNVQTSGRNRWLALMVLCLGTLMIVLDTTIVNVALPSIRVDL
jgi:hypothetical protein